MSLSGFKSYVNSLTIEPAMFFYTFALFIYVPALITLIENKATQSVFCDSNFGGSDFNTSTCLTSFNSSPKIKLTTPNLSTVQRNEINFKTREYIFLCGALLWIPPIFTSLFLSIWSDTVSHKGFILQYLPHIGSVVGSMISFFTAYFPRTRLIHVLLGPFVMGLTGTYIIIDLFAFTYLTSSTMKVAKFHQAKSHFSTYSIHICHGIVGQIFGLLICGLALKTVRLAVVFLIPPLGFFVAGLYTYFYFLLNNKGMPKSKKKKWNFRAFLKYLSPWHPEYEITSNDRVRKIIAIVLWIILIHAIYNFVTVGTIITLILWTRRKFHWRFLNFALLLLLWKGVGLIAFIGLPLILKSIKKFQISQYTLTAICLASQILGLVAFALANKSFVLYIGAILSILDVMTPYLLKHLMVAHVKETNIGKIYGLLCISICISSILSLITYLYLLESVGPNITFAISIIILVVAYLLLRLTSAKENCLLKIPILKTTPPPETSQTSTNSTF